MAVLAVFVFHLDRRLLPGGFVGVDVFFAISGYLITSILLADCDAGRFRFTRFYQRRIARLLAAFAAMGVATLAGAAAIYSSQDFASAGVNLAASAASVANIKLLFQGSYFALSPDAQPFLHCWSLSVEEQFYLFFPALFLLLHRTARPHLTKILVGLGLTSLLFCVILTSRSPEWAFYLLPARAFELLAGSVVAVSSRGRTGKPSARASVFVPWGLVLIGVAFVVISERSAFPGYLAALPVLGTALILGGGGMPGGIGDRFLSWAPMVAIGRASYSLYLWHWPIFSLVDYRFFLSSTLFRVALKVALGALATTISYLLIERPCRTYLGAPQRRGAALAAFGLSVATLVPVGILVRNSNYVDASPRDVDRGGLHFNESAKGGSVILMGDSNGAMYGKTARELAEERGLRLTVLSVAAGDPLPHSSGETSPLWLSSLRVVERERPDFLMVVCNWTKLDGDEGRLQVALDRLAPLVGKIVLLTQPAQLPANATRESIRAGARPPFYEESEERRRRLNANQVVRNARSEKVFVIDVAPIFERGGEALFLDELGRQLYNDRDHLSAVGAERVKPLLANALRKP